MKRLAVLMVALFWAVSAAPAAEPAKKNVILLLADDLGGADLGCYGSTFHETPNLDRLAADGMRFTAAYAACTVCSPTRAALMTGKYPARLHVTDWISGHTRPKAALKIPDWTKRLDPAEPTLAKAFKAAGYATAVIGKWHLGGGDSMPQHVGFDFAMANERGQPGSYFAPYGVPAFAEAPKGEFLTDREAEEACRWLRGQKERPFFLYLPFHAVHTPLAGKPEVVARFKAKSDPAAAQRNAVYAALLASLDEAVGRIRRTVEEMGVADRTVILFTSDNGGLLGGAKNPITSNPPFRAGKGSAWEGGVRVPLMVVAPGVTQPRTECAEPVMTIDLAPTLAALAGVPLLPGHQADGVSLQPLLARSGPLGRDALFWHYPHYHPGGATPYSAVRRGALRLVEFFETGQVELHDLAADPGEKTDLAAAKPAETADLRKLLADWRTSVGAQLPTPNPDADQAADKFAN